MKRLTSGSTLTRLDYPRTEEPGQGTRIIVDEMKFGLPWCRYWEETCDDDTGVGQKGVQREPRDGET